METLNPTLDTIFRGKSEGPFKQIANKDNQCKKMSVATPGTS